MTRGLMILGTLIVPAACRTVVPSDTGEPGDAAPVTDADTITPGDAADPGDATTTEGDAATEAGRLSERQIVLVRAARELVETQSTIVGGATFSYDCSGTILAVYAHAGIYLVDLFGNYTGNGVARLYGIATDYELLHKRVLPDPGDLIFWDNTYDRNEDGEWNDPLTHAGLVISVSDDGTVEYLHHNYRRGIVTAWMNLLEPETYRNDEGGELNSPMRMASRRASNPDLWLSSHLFKEFASMHLIQIQTAITDGREVVASRP